MTPLLKVPSLVDAMYSAIREQILTGEIGAGEPLTENDIAARYSVARPTAKAALERLVHEGLLTRATNKTARVPVLSVADVRDLYFSRGFLEREVMAALCVRRSVPAEAVTSLQELLDLDTVNDMTHVVNVVNIDISFHRALVESLNSPRLSRLYTSLMGEVHLCMAQVQANHLLEPKRIAGEHAAIVAAIEAGDEKRAVAEMNDHLERACVRLVGHLQRTGPDERSASRGT